MNKKNILNFLLKSREEKYKKTILFSGSKTIIQISTNMPFFPKNDINTDKILKYTLNYIISLYFNKILKIEYHYNFSGSFILMEIDAEPLKLKKKLFYFEDIFRIVDIDIYIKGEKISSKKLNLPEKRCFICNKPASFCRINATHPPHEIKKTFKSIFLKLEKFYLNEILKY